MFENQGPSRGTAFAQGYSKLSEIPPTKEPIQTREETGDAPKSLRASGADPFPVAPPAPHPDDDLTIVERDGALFVGGDIDLYQSPRFRAHAETYIAAAEIISPRIDLTDVSFVDSAGLAALLMLSRGAKEKGKILTVVATGAPRRVLRITGIDQAIVVEG